jgi:hypothetical protein
MRTEFGPDLDLYQVWHAINPTFGAAYRGRLPMPVWPHEYEYVAAVIAVPDVETVYRLTQDEMEDLRVLTVRPRHRIRSTSVGDVIVTPAGVVYRCAPFDWDLIGWRQ